MNYYQARQMRDDKGEPSGIWHFTCRNDDRIWPVGCTKDCKHTSAEEACQHWVETEIARGVRHGKSSWTTCHEHDCPNPANQTFTVGGPNGIDVALCPEHATDETAIAMFRASHTGSIQMVSSW